MATKRKDDIEFEVGIDGNITKYNEPKVNKKNNIEFEVDLDGNIHKNEYSKKPQLPKSAARENEKFSFSNALKNIEDTINNSAVKNHGLNLSNVITDIANINDAKNEFKATLPVIGNAYKTEKKAIDTINNLSTWSIDNGLRSMEGTSENISDWLVNPAEQKINYAIDYLKSGKKVADENLKDLKQMQERDIKKNLVQNLEDKFGYTEEYKKKLDDKSAIKRNSLVGQVVGAVGGMAPSLFVGGALAGPEPILQSTEGLTGLNKAKAIAGNVGKSFAGQMPSNLMLSSSSYGSGLEEALNNGATLEQARLYGAGSAAKEIATEWITGGIPGLNGTGGLDKPVEKLIDKTTGKLKNEYGKAIAKSLMNYGYKFVGEGLEEGLSDIIDPYLKNATYSKDEKINWEDVLNSFIVGGITGGILEAPNAVAEFNNNMLDAYRNNQNIKNNIVAVDSNQSKENNTITQNEIENTSSDNNLNQNITSQQNVIKPTLPVANNTLANENNIQSQNNIEGNPLIENNNPVSLPLDNNTVEKLNNFNKQYEKFDYVASDNNKVDNFRKSANQFMNNSNESKSFAQVVEKVINDKGYNITLDNSIGDNVNGRININENGEVDIRINPNSERAGEFILTHEITHAIENNEMKNLVMDYASKNREFNNNLENLKKIYNTEDVSDEVLADISGQLFGNQEFINNLSTKKPSIFKKIYNKIISFANKITGNSKESLFIKDLKNKWEQAYRNSGKKTVSENIENVEEKNSLIDVFKKKNEIDEKLSEDSIKEIEDKTKSNFKDKTDVKYIRTEDIAKIRGQKEGYRTPEQVKALTNNIIANGITSPIELTKDNQGNIEIYNGNHRFDIANKLGLKEIPVVYIKDSINLANYSNINYNNEETEYIRSNKNGNFKDNERIEEGNDKSKSFTKYSINDNNISADGRTTQRNDKIFNSNEGHNDRSSSNSTYRENIEQEGLENSSFSLDKNAKQYDDINEFGYFPEKGKYSKKDGSWQEFVEKNYKTKGTRTYFEETNLKTDNTEKNIINKEKEKILNKYSSDKKKNTKTITKEVSKILEFDNYKQKKEFTDLVSEYYDNPDFDKIKQDIKDKFSEKRIEYVDDFIKSVKKQIRETEINVPQYVKNNITDYSTFRKENFNKLRLKNQGQSIDSFYTELSESYPSVFSKDITNEADQLQRLSEFMNENDKFYEKYHLDDSVINEATQYVYDSVKNKDNIDDLINSISISPKQIRKEKIEEYRDEAMTFIHNSANWIDKKLGLSYKVNTMKRNFYDVMGKKDGERLYKNYIEPIFLHNAQMQKDIESYNKRVEKLNLNEKESIAVQMWGEYKYNPDTLVTGPEIDEFITNNKLDYSKIKNAAKEFRNIYDELITKENEILKSQGYKEKEYRKGYFPHFVEEHATSLLGKALEKTGWKFNNDSIPTDIAGITDTFKPGKVWNRSAQQRKGRYTDFNVLKGYDNYIRSAMETIYFTEDIQKLRALENEIRYEHSEKGVQTQIDELLSDTSIDPEERQEKIEKIYTKYTTPLNNLVTEIRDYTNGIANKKSVLDRTMEKALNRKVYSVMQNITNRLSANMVGLNLSSAITNFIPITQAMGEVKNKYLLKGLTEAIKNQNISDGFENKSVFLTSRLNEADRLYKTKLDKVSEKMNFMFDGIDSITANTIVRAKYYENIESKNMTEFEAMRNADEFARDLMAGRTKGEMPTIFNAKNPLIKIFTAFQLEVNNQYKYMFKDLPRDLKDEGLKKLLSAYLKMFFGAWIYNQITGTKAAFSPADTIQEIYDTSKNPNLKSTDKASDILQNLAQDIPFVGGLIGGGRLPISSLANPLNAIKGESTLGDETKKAIFYTMLPVGGGQLKKTLEGASLYLNNKEVKGSYNKKGELKFEAKTDPLSVSKNLLFGKYSSEEAQDYISNGYLPIDEKTMKKLKEQNISISEYRTYQTDKKTLGLSEIKSDKNKEGKSISGSSSAKKSIKIMESSYSKKEKNFLLSQVSSTKTPVTVNDLNTLPREKKFYQFYYSLSEDGRNTFKKELKEYDLTSTELIDYYNQKKKLNNEYTSAYVKEKLTEYITNSNFNNETKWYLYTKDYGNKSDKTLADKFNLKFDEYANVIQYSNYITKKYPGNKYSNVRKKQVFNYINSLKLNSAQKSFLYKKAGYSNTTTKNTIIKYIDSFDISKVEKNELYNYLY